MRIVRFALVAALAVAIASPAFAAEKVYDGTLVCAMCFLKKPDAKQCQDVLLVSDAGGAKSEYYITKNEVAKQAGEVCTQEVKATVTGTVSDVEGRTWLTPSKIEKHGTAEPHAHGHVQTP